MPSLPPSRIKLEVQPGGQPPGVGVPGGEENGAVGVLGEPLPQLLDNLVQTPAKQPEPDGFWRRAWYPSMRPWSSGASPRRFPCPRGRWSAPWTLDGGKGGAQVVGDVGNGVFQLHVPLLEFLPGLPQLLQLEVQLRRQPPGVGVPGGEENGAVGVLEYIDVSPARPLQLALCSLGVFAAATAAGLALFQRKDFPAEAALRLQFIMTAV